MSNNATQTPARPTVKVTPIATDALKTASADEVRVWGTLNMGSAAVKMSRGRISREVIEAYNSAHPRRKYMGNPERMVKITTTRQITDKAGRTRSVPVTKTATVREVRAWAVDHGYADMTRGRMTLDTYGAFAVAAVSA